MDDYKVVSRVKDKGSNKSLLSQGMIPGIIYGKNTDPTKIAFEEKILKKLINAVVFFKKFFELII